jgi:hypothetical protein
LDCQCGNEQKNRITHLAIAKQEMTGGGAGCDAALFCGITFREGGGIVPLRNTVPLNARFDSGAGHFVAPRGEYETAIRAEAFALYREREPARTKHDWMRAQAKLAVEGGKNLLTAKFNDGEIRPVAHEVWLKRREGSALEDWLDAERTVRAHSRPEA